MRSSRAFWLLVLAASALAAFLPRAPRAAGVTQLVERRYEPETLVLPSGAGGAVAWGNLPVARLPGRAPLPTDRFSVTPPAGMRLALVTVREADWTERALAAPLSVLPGVPAPDGGRDALSVPPVRAAGGYLRGERVETIEVDPVRLLGERGLRVARRIVLELQFEPDPVTPLHPREVRWEPRDSFADARARLTRNGALSRVSATPWHSHVNGADPFSPRFLPSEDGSPVRYLIVTTNAMSASYQVLADWKTSLGTPAVVRSVEWIRDMYPHGTDQAEEIREFVKKAVALWGVEYVLLGGDFGDVETRFAKTYYAGGENIPTDLYYTCLDGNWNQDGDQLFGEAYFNPFFSGDSADFVPDVWVGRAPTRTSAEAATWVEKAVAYERDAPLGAGFGEKMLILGEVLFPQTWSPSDTVIFDGAAVCESALVFVEPPLAPYRMYENYLDYPGAVHETKAAVLTQWNLGYNLVHHVGHGFRNTMALGENDLSLDNAGADALVNGDRQGMLYAINCTSSSFDYDCIAEHLLRNPSGGVVGSVGSTRLDYPATGWQYQSEFYNLVYAQGVTRMGEAAALQKLPFVGSSTMDSEDRWTQLSLVYMGDPDMDLHTDAVDSLSVSILPALQLGQSSYTVTVTDGAGPVENATVCLSKTGDAYGLGVTNASGQAVVAFLPDLPGAATLGARAHNHRSRVIPVTVTAPAGPHLFVSSVTVNDTGGDLDGKLESGESGTLTLVVGNQGTGASGAVALTASGAAPGLTITDPNGACAAVPAGGTRTTTDPIAVSVNPLVSDVSALGLTVAFTAGAYARSEPLVLYVGSPVLSLVQSVVRDTTGNGNGNGVVEAGEDQHWRLHLANRGLGRSKTLSATLTSTDPAVTILDGSSAYGDLEPEQSSGGDGFRFRFSDALLTHAFRLVVTDHRGTVMDRRVEIQPPAVPTGLLTAGAAAHVDLVWTPVATSDLAGYHVYRSTLPGGPFTRVTPVRLERMSTYRDQNLPALQQFYYRVAAIDSSGNESVSSTVAGASTSLPLLVGFPVATGTLTSSSPCLAHFQQQALPEIVTGGQEILVVRGSGEEVRDGDGNVQTLGPFTGEGAGPYWSPPAVADLDGDGHDELVGVGFQTASLYVWDDQGNVKPGWPKSLNPDAAGDPSVWSAPAIADLDNDNDLEIVVNAHKYTFAFHHTGVEVANGDGNPTTQGVLIVMGQAYNYSTPALADLDGDGFRDVIVGSRDGKLYAVHANGTALPGFPYNTGGEITGSPAVADLNHDGLKEVVFANANLSVYALNKNLAQPSGWPRSANMNLDLDSSPAIADLDQNGALDVILCSGNGWVYAWRGDNGQLLPGFGFQLFQAGGAPEQISSSPVVGNLDGDIGWEICLGANDGRLFAFNHDGTAVPGFPLQTQNRIEGAPLLWDVDGDGYTEVVVHSTDQSLYTWRSPGWFWAGFQPWPMFRRTSRHTGEVDSTITGGPTAVPGTGLDPAGPQLSAGFPNPFAGSTSIRFRVPDDRTGGSRVQLDVFDLAGRRVRTVAHGAYLPGTYTVSWDGADETGRRAGAGVYFFHLRVDGGAWSQKVVLLP